MKQPQQNLPIPSSFSEFFKTAYNLISNSFAYHQPRSLEDSITNLMSQYQIDQHNLIEIKSFELSKEIKSKFTRFNQQQIANVLIKVKNILEEMEKLCSSLKVKFLFQLFQKVALCLTMVASLNYSVVSGKNPDQPKKTKPLQQVDAISTDLKNSQGTSKKLEKTQKIINPAREASKSYARNKFRGISIYNQNYKRHIENRQLLISLNKVIKDSEQRRQFWKQLRRDFKQTIGVSTGLDSNSVIEGQTDQKQNDDKKFKELGIALHNKSSSRVKYQSQIVIPDAIIESEACHSTNAHNMMCNSSLFYYQLESVDFSVESLQKTMDEITLSYQNEKFVTLDTIKKIVSKFWRLFQQKIEHFKQIIKVEQQKILDLKRIIFHRYDNTTETSTQTSSYMSQTELNQCEKLKLDVKKLEHVVGGMENIISRQNMEYIEEKKRNIDLVRKLEMKERKCADLGQQVQNLETYKVKMENRIRMENSNKVEIESHCPTRLDLGEIPANNNLSLSNDQIFDSKIKQMDFITERLLNIKASEQGSAKGIMQRPIRKHGRNITFQQITEHEQNLQGESYLNKKSKFKSQKVIRFGTNSIHKDIIKEDRSEIVTTLNKQKRYIKFVKPDYTGRFVSNGSGSKNQRVLSKDQEKFGSRKNISIMEEHKKQDIGKSLGKNRNKMRINRLDFSSKECQFTYWKSSKLGEDKPKQFRSFQTKIAEKETRPQSKQQAQDNTLIHQTRLTQTTKLINNSPSVSKEKTQKRGTFHENQHKEEKMQIEEEGMGGELEQEEEEAEGQGQGGGEVEVEGKGKKRGGSRNGSLNFGSFQKWEIGKNNRKDFKQMFLNTRKNKKLQSVNYSKLSYYNDLCSDTESNYDSKRKISRRKSRKSSRFQNDENPNNSTLRENGSPSEFKMRRKLKKLSNANIYKNGNSRYLNDNFEVEAEPENYNYKNQEHVQDRILSKQNIGLSINLSCQPGFSTLYQQFTMNDKSKRNKVQSKKTSKRKSLRPKKVNVGELE